MILTDKEKFNALLQLTVTIISSADHNPEVPHELRREATVNEAHELLKRITARVGQEYSKS
jgi:hypothetical protein